MCDDLSRVVEQNSVRAIGKLVAQAVFARKINELSDQLSTLLSFALLHQLLMRDSASSSRLNLGKLLVLGLLLCLVQVL